MIAVAAHSAERQVWSLVDALVNGEVTVEQGLQRAAPWPVHRQQLVDAVTGHRAVAEDQVDLVGDRHAGFGQHVGVGGQLQQRLDLHRTGQLRVPQAVAVAVPDQEVGESGEAAVEHRGLIDHRVAALCGLQGGRAADRSPGTV